MKATHKGLMETIEFLGQQDPKQRFENLHQLVRKDAFILSSYDESINNIVVPSTTANPQFVLTAHWDVFPGSYGYNDNASGMAVLLAVQDLLPENFEIVFTDKEECGGKGSELYLKHNKPLLNINIDVIGWGEHVFYDDLNRIMQSHLNPDKFFPYGNVPFNDSYIFDRHGINSVLFISGQKRATLLEDIWSRQHMGELDNDITQINTTPMLKMIAFLKDFFKQWENFFDGECIENR